MSKEATVFVIDSGYSMKSNALKSSIEIIKRMLEIIMFKNRKNDHVGIVTVGSLKTINRLYEQGQGYENITEFGLLKEKEDILERPTKEHLMYLLGIEHETNADIFEGTIIAVKMLMDHCISKKTGKPLAFNKKIYIFTDCKSPVQFDYLDTVINQCDSNSISITIVGFNLDLGQAEACTMMRLCQRKNPALGSFFSGEEALESVEGFATKEVSLTTLYRGPLTFGESTSHLDSALSIDVYIYNKTSELKFNSAKKFSSLAENVPKDLNDKNFGTVETVYEYKVRKDEDIPGISEDKGQIVTEIIRGFRYGSHIIPFTPEDQEAALFTTTKSFQILYFTNASSVML
jgi:ATP-dependent DNA helicase 2 subunit 2